MIYLLLLAGVFMGWSLGTNDAANAFGTAVATGVVKYRHAIWIIAVLVVIGSGECDRKRHSSRPSSEICY